ncbi:hypothetical protein [Streptomyces prunicolor]
MSARLRPRHDRRHRAAARTDRTDADLAAAVRLALDGGTPGGVEPLD